MLGLFAVAVICLAVVEPGADGRGYGWCLDGWPEGLPFLVLGASPAIAGDADDDIRNLRRLVCNAASTLDCERIWLAQRVCHERVFVAYGGCFSRCDAT